MDPKLLRKSPRDSANFFSKMSLFWLTGFFKEGYSKDLGLQDLHQVPEGNTSKELGDALTIAWQKELYLAEEANKQGKVKAPSLRRAIVKVFFWSYTFLGLFAFIDECIIRILQPLVLGFLIRFFSGEIPNATNATGYFLAAGIVFGSALYTLQHHPFFLHTQVLGMRMRVAASALVYRKALKLSQAALNKTTVGQLTNFLANDVNRFDLCTGFLHYLWIGPLQLTMTIFILWNFFGWTCLIGAVLLFLFVPFQSFMGSLFGKLRLQIAERSDKRIRIMNEIVSAIKVIKMYTWEIPFSKLVANSREEEIDKVRKTATLRAVNLSFFYISSKAVIFLTLLVYVLSGSYLNAEKVFVTLALYNNVRLIMTLFFPNAISQLSEVLVSINRIQNFLLMEEREGVPKFSAYRKKVEIEKENKCMNTLSNSFMASGQQMNFDGHAPIEVRINNLSAKWSDTAEDMTLSNISCHVQLGELLAVIGPVGSGKGSLLQAILKELPASEGDIFVNGKIAYASQEPWVFGKSVRENILFGREFDAKWYQRVIEACALKRDFELLPYRDHTLVGDRGASLSGGQKARVNLARAVYSNGDIVLLDDPLSAVDAEVGRHLYEKCIRGILRSKLVILVTHQLQFLKSADEIILLKQGKVEAQGSYRRLLKSGINFAKQLEIEEMHQVSPPKKLCDTAGVRRSVSTSMLENMTGSMSSSMIAEEFDVHEEDSPLVKSYTFIQDKPDLSFFSLGKHYGTFAKNKKKHSRSPSPMFKSFHTSDNSEEKPLMHEETRSTGDITIGLYLKFIRAGSSWLRIFSLLVLNLTTQVLFTGCDYWLKYWTATEEARAEVIFAAHNQSLDISNTVDGIEANNDVPGFPLTRQSQVLIYTLIIALLFLVSLTRTSVFLHSCLHSSISLHKSLYHGVLRAPMRFFEINPIGRVLNRFAKDIGIIDETLPIVLFDTIEVGLQVIGVGVVISIVNPLLVAPALVVGILFYFIRRFYLKTARDIKRLEGLARSPVFSQLSTSLHGLTTIRAYQAEETFESSFDAAQDLHSAGWYLFLASARWLGVCIDWVSVVYIGIVTFSFMFFRQDGAAVGLAVSSALSLTGMFQWGVRQSAEAENQMVSVERVFEYSELDPEAPLNSRPGKEPPHSWPSRGEIEFRNIVLRYANSPPILKNISIVFKSEEKIGIVGRTGAGKSSLLTALFRLAEPESGSILIDGVNTLNLGLADLRSKISIIPQDPVLFTGSLRRNLDPFDEHSDAAIWKVLEEVHLATVIREIRAGIYVQVAEGGSNFSVGQRQLVCLARAILRQNKILVLDEATANVDPETDGFIQKTIHSKFKNCTVLTVAHRLNTVIDSDKILVLDGGEVKEYGEPHDLLDDPNGFLSQLVNQTGKTMALKLRKIAKKVHESKIHPTNSLFDNVLLEMQENGNASNSSSSSKAASDEEN